MMQLLKYHLQNAQERMKTRADKHKTKRQFSIRDWVYLKLHPYKQILVANRQISKAYSMLFLAS